VQSPYLDQVIAYATEIREKLGDLAASQKGRVHFRPTSNGITMIGLLPSRPQRGRGGYSANRLLRDFETEFHKYCEDIPQGRSTPEKELQSFLIRDAYQHRREFTVLRCPESEIGPNASLHFVTDELAMLAESGQVVCDILALYRTRDQARPVVMELKSARQMRRLVEQLTEYAAIMEQYYSQFERLYSAALGERIHFSGPPERWLVWPAVRSGADPREAELARQGIRVVQYERDHDGFRFHVGIRPLS
jgi:hypothetical protein